MFSVDYPYESTAIAADFIESANEQFNENGIGSTPTYMVGEERLEFFDQATEEVLIQPTPEDVLRAIQEIAG